MTLIVNGERIEDSVIGEDVERLRPDYERVFADQSPEEREVQLLDWSRENVIERVLISQEAEKYGGAVSVDEVASAFEQMKERCGSDEEFYKRYGSGDDAEIKREIELQLRIERMFADICRDLREPSKEDIRKFYEENKEEFESAEQIRVGHIVKHIGWQADEVRAESVIRKAQAELKKGAVFEMLVAKYSDCPEKGGDLGYITRGQMVEEFDDVVFNLGINEASDVFRTRFGFHIAKLYDRKPRVLRDFEEVRGQVVDMVKEQMRSEAIDGFIDRLRSEAQVEEV